MNDNRASLLGSSPLTRGKPGGGGVTPLPRRLIPAHAGKTFAATSYTTFSGAHPRSRGENSDAGEGLAAHAGSSPLTRGKRSPPRSAPSLWGSSPLTRGKQVRGGDARGRTGLIPAHAGKTTTTRPRRCATRAHPRSRGENRRRHDWRRDGPRLIPAHAGKTPAATSIRLDPAAHPRSRGENPSPRLGFVGDRGSSPLTRGKPVLCPDVHLVGGLIPAHAGKTRS